MRRYTKVYFAPHNEDNVGVLETQVVLPPQPPPPPPSPPRPPPSPPPQPPPPTLITDANFRAAIATCLEADSAYGMCSASEYGAMPGWNVALVTDMSEAFSGSRFINVDFNADISGWDTSSATTMRKMFLHSNKFNRQLANWNTSRVTDMAKMFADADVFNQPLEAWNTASVTSMAYMFLGTAAFNQSIGGWNTTSVTTMAGMFYDAAAFNQPLAAWDTSSVETMGRMFHSAAAFAQDITGWATGALNSNGYADVYDGAAAWLAKFQRTDGSGSVAGPPSDWELKAE